MENVVLASCDDTLRVDDILKLFLGAAKRA
jgi:hypothetical protein